MLTLVRDLSRKTILLDARDRLEPKLPDEYLNTR